MNESFSYEMDFFVFHRDRDSTDWLKQDILSTEGKIQCHQDKIHEAIIDHTLLNLPINHSHKKEEDS